MTKEILDSVHIDGIVTATTFVGSGASLTGIPQNAVLTGIITTSGGNVSEADTLNQAIGKIEYKVNHIGSGADSFYEHDQPSASNLWTITHNLGKFPSVSVVDSANNAVIGDIQYINSNQLTITFGSSFGGKAYLN